MKQKIILLFLFLVLMISIPILSKTINAKDTIKYMQDFSDRAAFWKKPRKEPTKSEFKVLDESKDEILNINVKDFLICSVACEMDPDFEPEALKAQAVAAYTYFKNLQQKQKNKPTKELRGCDFAVNSENRIYYMTEEKLKERWGEDFEKYYNKFADLIDEVLGEYMQKDEQQYIEALYFSISSGNTENIEDVFGGEKSYLISVPSPYDTLAPGYLTKKEVSLQEFKEKLGESICRSIMDCSFDDLLGPIERTKAGMVKAIQINKRSVTGREMRKIFDLRSANFDIEQQNDKIIFTVRGYGHGVGMSQYGANEMAKQGADYHQILSWYYRGVNFAKDNV